MKINTDLMTDITVASVYYAIVNYTNTHVAVTKIIYTRGPIKACVVLLRTINIYFW